MTHSVGCICEMKKKTEMSIPFRADLLISVFSNRSNPSSLLGFEVQSTLSPPGSQEHYTVQLFWVLLVDSSHKHKPARLAKRAYPTGLSGAGHYSFDYVK
ncbi:hypothetical protein M9458_057384 [Cirrhinus mrigala]|uniref:Uncharacterized protein n=1 Tax=Cirrhinus mrigala TaxID=683832 RepID=A0ABD0MEM9_CIRMR